MAFRDTRGEVGLIAANCPHRGASLFFGRNEDCGIRCVYHGWKFDVSGRCVDMPNEPAESTFKDKVRARAYPCRDVNGVLWTYMGPRAQAPTLPAFEVNTLPPDHVYPPLMMLEECNWVQALEGDIDSSHIDYVHAKLRPDSKQRGTFHQDKRPRLELLPTDYGACYSARRRWDVDGLYWHRITQFILPFFSMIAASDPNIVSARAWVPLDDNYNLQIMMRGRLDRPVTDQERELTENPFTAWGGYLEATSDPHSRYYTKANIHNDYLVDRQLAKNELMIGIPFLVNLQDRAMTETMGPIYDRTQEHLGTTDAMVIYVRRRLIESARALREHGVVPANVDDRLDVPGASGLRAAARRRQLDHGDREGTPVGRGRADRVGAVRAMSAGEAENDGVRDLAYYEAVPYLLVVESVERSGGWLRRAEYPELPGCFAEAESAVEAIEKLDDERRRLIRRMWDRGAPIPAPRAPLRSRAGLVALRAVDQVQERRAVQVAPQILREQGAAVVVVAGDEAGDVRRQDGVRGAVQGVAGRRRLLREHVDGGARDAPDRRAPARVQSRRRWRRVPR